MPLMIQIETVICLSKWCPTQWLLIDEEDETYYARFRYEDLTVDREGPAGERVFCEPQAPAEENCMSFPELKHALRGKFDFPDWVKQQLLVEDPYSDAPGTMPCGQWKFELDTPREMK